jgi:hypothetical protein
LGATPLKLGKEFRRVLLKDFNSVQDDYVTGEYNDGGKIFRKRK